jgi:nitrate/nitrite transporter NarK
MALVAYAPIIGQIASDLKVDAASSMDLMSVTYLSTAVMLLFAGAVCDKLGIKVTLLLGMLLAAVPASSMPLFGHSYSHVFMLRLIQGAAPAFVMVAVGPVTAFWFPKKEHGLAGGIMMGALSVGAALGLVSSPVMLKAAGSWQNAVAFLSLFNWLGMMLTFLISGRVRAKQRGALEPRTEIQEAHLTFRRAVALPITWIAMIMLFFNFWDFHSLYALVPPFLASPRPMGIGLGAVTAGKLSLALTIVGIFAVLAGGLFLDRVVKGNFRIVFAIGFIVAGVSSYLVLLAANQSSISLLVICLMLAGWGIPFMNSAVNAFVVSTYPPSLVGRMIGWLSGIGNVGGAVGVYLGGVAIGMTGSYTPAIGMISIAALGGLLVSYFLRPKQASA